MGERREMRQGMKNFPLRAISRLIPVAVFAFFACATLFLTGINAHADRIERMKNSAEAAFAKSKQGLAEAKAALSSAESAKALAVEYKDAAAMPVANHAVATARQAVRLAKKNVLARKLWLRRITADYKVVRGMDALAARLGWGREKRKHLNDELNDLPLGHDFTTSEMDIRLTWLDIEDRGPELAEIVQAASKGEGPVLSGAGRQTGSSCAVFALASATNLPYGVVAARADKLISEGNWRTDVERADPGSAIERNGGLNGGEVIMLADIFGQSKVLPSSGFAKSLQEGQPVMVDVAVPGGDHEVVLDKTFQYNGNTWFQMIDSNQGPMQRRYLSGAELNGIILEKGVAYRPNKGTVPGLLR